MTPELILGLVGSITGCLSLGYSINKILSERAKIDIKLITADNSTIPSTFSFSGHQHFDDYPSQPFRIIVKLAVINKSSLPIYLLDAKIISKAGKIEYLSNPYSYAQRKYTASMEDGTKVHYSVEEAQIKFPKSLSSYEPAYGFLFFPWVSQNFDSMKNENWRIVLNTSRGSFKSDYFKLPHLSNVINTSHIKDDDI